ncbi:MAG: SIMPL domain-containing protein [Candidatus Pacebacteria bacterium]|nr:SIMPL domain-containing protein [Candidatus Paceibacterota bacterium]
MDNQNLLSEIKEKHKSPIFILIIVLCVFLAVITVSALIEIPNKIKEGKYLGRQAGMRDTITITGKGEVYAKPDLAVVDFSVRTEGAAVDKAIEENTQKMNKVIEAVKGEGIEDKDIKTVSFSIYPRYEYQRVEIEIYPYPPGKRVLTGYEVFQQIEVKIRNMENIGKVIEKAAAAGSNEVGSLYFKIDKEDEFKNQARTQAIENAKNKANELASALGIKLVKIVNFQEDSYVPPFYSYGLEAVKDSSYGLGGAVPAPDIETGESKISSNVSIVYEIE